MAFLKKCLLFCIGGGAYDPADGMWKPNENGLGYGRVLDFIGVRY